MSKSEKKIKSNRSVTTAAIILLLVAFSTAMVGFLLARYFNSSKGKNTAKVASFDVSAVSDTGNLSLSGETEAEYKITVTNRSQVAVGYSVTVEFSGVLPHGANISLDGKTCDTLKDEKLYTFNNVGTLDPGNVTKDHRLIFSFDPSLLAEGDLGDKGEADFDFDVNVTFVQID